MEPAEGEMRRDCWTVAFGEEPTIVLSDKITPEILAYKKCKLGDHLPLLAAGNSYNDAERCVCAGYDNGDIKLFDLRTMTQRWETNIKNGVSTPHVAFTFLTANDKTQEGACLCEAVLA